jgi:protein-tyrosine phosphatase
VAEDFTRFQRILAMDDGHLQWLQDKAPPASRAQLELLMAHAVKHSGRDIVPDPYYGSDRDFALALDLVEDACDGLVAELGRELAAAGLAGDVGR